MVPHLAAAAGSVASSVVASVFLLVWLAAGAFVFVAAVKVANKAGYSGWWVLALLVPIANVVVLLVFAFSEWPVTREVKALRAQVRAPAGSWPPPAWPPPPNPEPPGAAWPPPPVSAPPADDD